MEVSVYKANCNASYNCNYIYNRLIHHKVILLNKAMATLLNSKATLSKVMFLLNSILLRITKERLLLHIMLGILHHITRSLYSIFHSQPNLQ